MGDGKDEAMVDAVVTERAEVGAQGAGSAEAAKVDGGDARGADAAAVAGEAEVEGAEGAGGDAWDAAAAAVAAAAEGDDGADGGARDAATAALAADADGGGGAGRPGRKLTRRRFVLGAAVAGGVVAVGTTGTVGTLLLYGSSEGAGGGEPPESAKQPARSTGTGTRRLPDTGTPRAAGTDAAGGAADEATDGAADTADAAQASPSTDDGVAAPGGSSGGGNSSGGSGGGSTGGGSGGSTPQRRWHEGWNEWVVDEPGHYNITIVHHDAVYYDKPVYGGRCDCGFTFIAASALYAHQDATGHGGYVTGVQVGTERELIKEAWDEEVREWVPEKGHNVWHEGYWE